MQKLLATALSMSLLVINFSAALAQRKPAKNTPASLAAQRGAELITAAQLRDYLSFIASDVMEGRDTPSRGLDTAAQFIATNLSRWGLKPAGDDGTFFQKIALSRTAIEKAETNAQFNNQLLTFGADYIPLARSTEITGQL